MRIFIGASEVANFIASYQYGFKELGYQTYSVISRRNAFLPTEEYNVVLSENIGNSRNRLNVAYKIRRSIQARIDAVRYFLKALFSCDVFIYNTGGSLLPAYLDYLLIKALRKKLVVVFLGSEIRHWYAYQKEMQELGKYQEIFPFIKSIKEQRYGFYVDKLRRVRKAERYADLILSQPGFAQLQKKRYMRVFVGLKLPSIKYNVPDNEIPIVVHAPTSRGIKGTEYVIKAVEQLKKEGLQIDFQLIENMPHNEMLKILEHADILVDELFSDSFGVLSAEAMAAGTVVLTNYFAEYAKVPRNCPAVRVNKDNIVESLRRVLVDRDLRRQLAREGRVYVEEHQDAVKICRQILEWLKPGGITGYDFIPSIYKSIKIPKEILWSERKQARAEKMMRISKILSR